ncbi:MAG: hypothetical protein Q8K47_11285, partial [Nitrosomonas sp.]|nr:hypothetical protein [Nitrosomonas sp.]
SETIARCWQPASVTPAKQPNSSEVIIQPGARSALAQSKTALRVKPGTNAILRLSKQRWRRIEFIGPKGEEYAYLTNDFSLEPGELAFIYHRRWDEEKFFDNFKNDLAGAKSLGKNPNSH